MPDVVETVRDDGEKAREDRGEKEVVKDDEGRGISVSAARLHTEAAMCWKASACSLLLDRGIPSRDARINRFPVRPYKRAGGRRNRWQEQAKGAPKGEEKRCKGEARPLNTYRRYERKTEKGRERERKGENETQKRAGKIGSTKIGSRVY